MVRLAAYQALNQMAQAQRAALADPELERFFALSREREAIFERLKAAEAEPATAEEQAQIDGLIRQILETDREIEAEVGKRQDAVRKEIAALQPGMNALHAYLQEAERQSFFIDRNH